MSDPMTLAIAAAMAGKAVEFASESAKSAMTAIAHKVKERFRGHPDDAVLTAAAENPESTTHVDELARAIQRAMAEDPAFRTEIDLLWNQVQAGSMYGGTVNNFYGRAEKIIMMRDVDGGLTIN
jgi:hypothetical protein